MPSFLNRLKAAFASEPTLVPTPSQSPGDRLEAAGVAEEAARLAPQDMVGLSTTGMLHKAFESRFGEQHYLANCNLEIALYDIRAAAPEDVDVRRCGRCFPNTANSAASRRKTLARRSPELVYLVSPQPEAGIVVMKAWFADEYGRLDRTRGMIAKAEVTEVKAEEMPTRETWLTSKETDRIYTLHEEVRDGLFQLDDAIREALKG